LGNRNLVYPKETIYFILCCIVSVGLYIAAVFMIILLPIIIAIVLLSLFFHAVSIGSIRGNGVRVSERQFPDVYERIQVLSADMGLRRVPDVFILQSEGALNAFATRFFGRNVVVLYSEVFELARQKGEKELEFIIAHELAHVKRRHIWKNWLTLPAMWVPFLGEAYSRSAEYTCDRHAAHYINDGQAAKNALMILGIGKVLYREVNEDAYLQQIQQESNPFVWLSEKWSTHPALPKRIQQVGQFMRMADTPTYQSNKGKIIGGVIALFLAVGLLYGAIAAGFAYALTKIESSDLFASLAASDDYMLQDEEMTYDDSESEVTNYTDLMDAASVGDTERVAKLLDSGADIDELDSEGSPALHYAVYSSQHGTTEQLLKEGADPNMDDLSGYTPLFIAYDNEDTDMAELLMKYGADPDQEDLYGDTPRSLAEQDANKDFLPVYN
jgi:Zn-dependent protease with chaperone function